MAIITDLNCNLREAVKVKYLDGNLFSQDVYGNAIRVIVMDGDEPATLSGTVSGIAVRADGGSVAISDSRIDGNVATIVLPAAVYAIPGPISIVIKIADTYTVTTLAAVVTNVYQSSTDTVVDPGTIIPSINALIEQIAAAVATIPADYSDLWTSLAPAFSTGTSYAVGQYVTYDGGLYRFKNAHSGSWASADVDAVDLGSGITKNANDISDLKSALSFYTFGRLTSRIDWDTTNKEIVIGTGHFIYGNGYKDITSAITVQYTNFNNTTVLIYNTAGNFVFAPFTTLVSGEAVALFEGTKVYTPYDYSKIYIDGQKITTDNVLNGFASFDSDTNMRINNVDEKADYINTKVEAIHPETEIYSQSNETKYNNTNEYIWIIDELQIKGGTVLTEILLDVITASSKTFKISLWNTVTGEKYFDREYTKTPSNGQVKIDLCKKITVPTKIGFYSTNGDSVTVTKTNANALLYIAPNGTNLSNTAVLNNWQINATIKAVMESPIIMQEIHVGDGLEYEEIQDALDTLTSNYATIIVHPKQTPYSRFSLMRKLTSNYPWGGLSEVKHISIIGVDKDKCVIQSNTGNYDSPPAEIATNGIIKNLTFIATHTASDGTETTGAYAVHVDNRPADTNGMKLTFENCDFISYQTAAVGLGLYKNQDILFKDCSFISHTDITWKPNNDYNSSRMCSVGSYFMHTAMGYASGNMFIRFRRCMFYHDGGSYSVRIKDDDAVKTAFLEAIGNTAWDVDSNNDGVVNDMNKFPYNYGNNSSLLNA